MSKLVGTRLAYRSRLGLATLAILALPALARAQGAAGDNCQSPIVAVLGANAVDTTLATDSPQGYDDTQCPFGGLGFLAKDIWLSYTPSESGLLAIGVCNSIDWDSDLVVYTGSCAGLVQVACNGDAFECLFTSSVSGVPATAGQTLLIRLGGWGSTDAGSGTLWITPQLPEAGSCSDGVDNDLDGLADCLDPDCASDPACTSGPQFRRGDCNASGATPDISDSVFLLGVLFSGQGAPPCDDGCDANDDGAMNIADAVYSLAFLFSAGPAPPAPGPAVCGTDPTADMLGCGNSAACP